METGDPSSPSPGHQASSWGQRHAEAGPEHGPVGGPGLRVPMASQGRAMGSYRPVLL